MLKVNGLNHFPLKSFGFAIIILLCGAGVTFAKAPKSRVVQGSSKQTADIKSNFKFPPSDLFKDESQLRKPNPVEPVPYPSLPERQQLYRTGLVKGPTPLVQYLMTEVDIVGMYRTQKSTGAMLKVKGGSAVIGARVGDLFFNGPIQQILVYTDKKQGDEGGPALLPGQPAGEIKCDQVTRYSDNTQQHKVVTLTYIPRR
jgi:hypothetical protein